MCDEFDTSCVAAANDTEPAASYGVDMNSDPKGGVMKVKGSRRLVARLGLALAVAAIAAPGAQAVTMNAMFESGGGGSARLYADDVHQPLPLATLKASNVRTDAASPYSSVPGSNVQTDGASFQPTPLPVSFPASNVRTDAASSQPVLYSSNVQTDAPTMVKATPVTDARHAVLFERKPYSAPLQASATSDPGIDWSVAAIGAILGALGLMLLIAVVLFSGRHNNRRGRLAAT
jgi:hypothetical protein